MWGREVLAELWNMESSLRGLRIKGGENPEHLEFSFREMFSMISVPHRDIERGSPEEKRILQLEERTGHHPFMV